MSVALVLRDGQANKESREQSKFYTARESEDAIGIMDQLHKTIRHLQSRNNDRYKIVVIQYRGVDAMINGRFDLDAIPDEGE